MQRTSELGKLEIDLQWPYQVALPADAARGCDYVLKHSFCEGLSLCPRKQILWRGGQLHLVFCFAEQRDSELFQHRFGGTFVEPAAHPGWPANKDGRCTARGPTAGR
jgi:hypothetical protein